MYFFMVYNKNILIIILVFFYEKDILNVFKINVIFCIFNIVVVYNIK